eukprot:5072412-Prymnesium_polylepis.4
MHASLCAHECPCTSSAPLPQCDHTARDEAAARACVSPLRHRLVHLLSRRDMIESILHIKRHEKLVTPSRDGTVRVWHAATLNHLKVKWQLPRRAYARAPTPLLYASTLLRARHRTSALNAARANTTSLESATREGIRCHSRAAQTVRVSNSWVTSVTHFDDSNRLAVSSIDRNAPCPDD